MPLPELHPPFCIHLDYFLFSQCSSSWSHSWWLHPALHTAASMAFINVFHFSSCLLADDSGKRDTLSIAVKSNKILNTNLKIAERLCGSDAGKQNQCLLLHVRMPQNRLQVRRQQEHFVSIVFQSPITLIRIPVLSGTLPESLLWGHCLPAGVTALSTTEPLDSRHWLSHQ